MEESDFVNVEIEDKELGLGSVLDWPGSNKHCNLQQFYNSGSNHISLVFFFCKGHSKVSVISRVKVVTKR